jgi:hypothetical protein
VSPPTSRADLACEEFDPLGCLRVVPAGEIGDALAVCVEPGAAADDAGNAFDNQLGFRATVGLVVDAVGVGDLVHEGRDLAVRGQSVVDDDSCFACGAIAGASL